MKAAMPSATRHQYQPPSQRSLQRPRQRLRRPWRRFLHPLTAICAVQAVLSLTLIWSNTAYIDEADYLWVGRLEIAHWLHGTPWPSAYAYRLFSGSPFIYPPVLLYFTASWLISRTGAVFAAALWAFSEPALRLAFATYDPLSVLLTALSALLVVQAGYRRRGGAFVAAAAVALALANMTAYSGIVIDPVVIAFAFFVWLPCMRAGQALARTAWLVGGWAALFGLLMTASHSWAGLLFTVVARNIADHQSIAAILNEILGYSGLIIGLAVIGGIAAINTENRSRAALLVVLSFTVFIVPAVQLHDQTAWSIDKHLAYGIWFAAIVSAYGCGKFIHRLSGTKKPLTVFCCLVALSYIAANSLQSAWGRYHAWPDAGAFISSFRPAAAQTRGLIYVPGHEANIAEYYTPQGREWTRWSAALSLAPAGPRNAWRSYYSAQLQSGNYGVITLFYATTFSSAPELPGSILLSPHGSTTVQTLLGLVGDNSGEPGLPALTLALEQNRGYRLVAVGPYDGSNDYSIYAIWQKKAQK